MVLLRIAAASLCNLWLLQSWEWHPNMAKTKKEKENAKLLFECFIVFLKYKPYFKLLRGSFTKPRGIVTDSWKRDLEIVMYFCNSFCLGNYLQILCMFKSKDQRPEKAVGVFSPLRQGGKGVTVVGIPGRMWNQLLSARNTSPLRFLPLCCGLDWPSVLPEHLGVPHSI